MPNAAEVTPETVEAFIERWQSAEASERANDQLFLAELCDLIDLPQSDPAGADHTANADVFDRAITRHKPENRSRREQLP